MQPDDVTIATHDGVRAPVFDGFVREQRGVNTAVHYPAAPPTGLTADLVPTSGVARVNADTHNIAGGDRVHMNTVERLIDDPRITQRVPVADAST